MLKFSKKKTRVFLWHKSWKTFFISSIVFEKILLSIHPAFESIRTFVAFIFPTLVARVGEQKE